MRRVARHPTARVIGSARLRATEPLTTAVLTGDIIVLKNIVWTCAMMCTALSCGGCLNSAEYPYPTLPEPICLVARDPNEMYFAKQNLKPFKADKILIIPLYQEYRHGDMTDAFAIAHPFLCRQGEDIEPRLASFGQREKLANLVFWVPGYFPGAMRGVSVRPPGERAEDDRF